MRFSAGDVRGHIVSQKNDHGASYRRYKVLGRRSGLRNQLLRDFQRPSIFDFCNTIGTKRTWHDVRLESASLIGHLRSSTFRLSTYAVSMSLAGSCFSSESAPRPFHHGIRGRGGTIFRAALPSEERQDQADSRTHLIHRPARDIFPPLGGALVFSYRI